MPRGRRATRSWKLHAQLKSRSPTVDWICKLPRTVSENAHQTSVHVEHTSRTGEHCETHHHGFAWDYSTNALCTLPCGTKIREFEKAEIKKVLSQKVIKPAQTKWAAPIVFALKMDDSLRFGVDYRKLYTVTKRDLCPIPQDECIDSLGKAALFSTMDANSGNRQVEVGETHLDKTEIASYRELYRFVQIFFRLKNAKGTFQRAMDVILSRVIMQFVLYISTASSFSCAHFATKLSMWRESFHFYETEGLLWSWKRVISWPARLSTLVTVSDHADWRKQLKRQTPSKNWNHQQIPPSFTRSSAFRIYFVALSPKLHA